MGRHDTVAWQRIIALCTIYGVDINDIKKKSKKILSLYSDLVVLKRAKEDEFSFLYPCPPLDYMKALDILDKLDPDQGKHDLSIIIYHHIKVEWFTELVEDTISVKNNWFDTEGRAFIYFSIEEIMELLNCGKNKAVKALQELDSVEGIGLVEKERQGQGKATRIYVKNFVIEDSQKFTFEASEEKEQDSEVYISNFKKFDFGDSRSLKSKTQEVCFSGANNTNINNTNDSYTESNLIVSADEMGYDASPIFKAYVQLIRENLAVDTLIEREPMDRELLEGIYELVLETVMTSGQEIIIASNRYPAELVKSKFMKLNSGHVEYVVDSLKSNTTKVRNIKKYLLAALFNAPSTISGYYQAEVNHDMPQFARVR